MILDAGDGIAEAAATRLATLGYTDLQVISGGMPAWDAAGLGVYKGVNVPSKTLGELAETLWHPAMITAPELAEWSREDRSFRFFDGRPPAEYEKMRVPGSVCLPNGELAHRVASFDGIEQAPLVITCAGRTRGIVGAIGMRISGYSGDVLALENGTQGWALAGEKLDRGASADPFPPLNDAGLAASSAAADRILSRFGLSEITMDEAAGMLRDVGRTTYLFDTRTAAEASDDPVPGAAHGPCGQITQATDQWIATFRSRVILCCDSGLRSALAAFWLVQLGYEVHVLRLTGDREALPKTEATPAPEVKTIAAPEAMNALSGGATLLDLRPSMTFRKAHVDGAQWTCRPRLAAMVPDLSGSPVLLLAEDEAKAAWTAQDLQEAGLGDVAVVAGGHDALVKAGAAIVATPDHPSDAECIDHLFFVHDRHDGNLEASRRYLEWETGLIAQLSDVERAEYKLLHP
nr:rhodanese-like domain-containing protein [Thetidibacter halocola]